MQYKSSKQARQTKQLWEHNPALFAVLCTLDALAQQRFHKEILVTSVWRDDMDPNGLHVDWRAADLRIYNKERDGAFGRKTTLLLCEMQSLTTSINLLFDYGHKRSMPWKRTTVAHIREKRTATGALLPTTHCHIQERGRRYWA